MSQLKALSGRRKALGLVAGLGLVAAFAMPALATHETDLDLVPVDLGNTDECEGADFAFKLDGIDQITEGADNVYTADDAAHTVWIEIEFFFNDDTPPEVVDFEILDSDPAIDSIVIKQPQEGGGISHLTFCYNIAESEAPPSVPASEAPPSVPASEAPPSEAPPSEVAESELPGESEAPAASETVREDTLGSTPTPAPSVPNTAMEDPGQMPATVLSLVLIGALAAMVYVRLARQR